MVEYSVDNGRATLMINDPGRRNPMSAETIESMHRFTRQALDDESVRVMVYTGAGDRAFSAGGDLAAGFVDDPLGLHRARGRLADLFRLMWRGGKPTVARVNGHALAGGFGLAVACDITVCVDDAKLGTPEIDVGLWPMMISAVLGRVMPPKAVLDLMMTGRLIGPDEALALGAVNRVVPRHRLDAAVDEVVETLLSKSPVILAMGRDSFYAMLGMGPEAALDLLQTGLTAVSMTEDAQEGVLAFVEKRPARWQGR